MRISRKKFISGALQLGITLSLGSMLLCKKDEKKEGKLLRLQNKENPSVLEKKHVPGIETEKSVKKGDEIEVRVKVGYAMEHPSTSNHWIRWIKLQVNGKQVGIREFKTGGDKPTAVFKVKLEEASTMEAIADCNLHGTWISEPFSVAVS